MVDSPLIQGTLFRRSRYSSVTSEHGQRRESFQELECSLTKDVFTVSYSKRKIRGVQSPKIIESFPVQNIGVEECTETFKDSSDMLCFQVHIENDDEVLHFAVQDSELRTRWIAAFKAAAKYHEPLLNQYHPSTCIKSDSEAEKLSCFDTMDKNSEGCKLAVAVPKIAIEDSAYCSQSFTDNSLLNRSSNNQGNKKGTSQDTLIQGMSKIDEEHIILRKITTTEEEISFDQLTMHLYKFSQPFTDLVLHHDSLLAGNEMLQVWNTTDEELIANLNVSGQMFNLDSWDDYVAVGSSVSIQLIQLNQMPEPKRILYEFQQPVSDQSQFLVTFCGNKGQLVTAKSGTSRLDIWPELSKVSDHLVRPDILHTVRGRIICLAAPKKTNHPWVAAIAGEMSNSVNKFLCLCHWDSNAPGSKIKAESNDVSDIFKDQNSIKSIPCLTAINEMHVAVGNERKVTLLEGRSGKPLCYTMLNQEVSCLSHSQGIIVVGTMAGEVKILTDTDLVECHQFKNEQTISLVAAAIVEGDLNRAYIAHKNGFLAIWNATSNIMHCSPANKSDIKFYECTLGMQLCCEGILSNRRIVALESENSLSISHEFSDVHLQLPPEALSIPNAQIEIASAPLGPVGSHFHFPEGMVPVSPAVWLCFFPQKTFDSPAILKLPHCFECKSLDDTKHLCCLKAEHENITRDASGQISISFKEVDKVTQSEFPTNQYYGIVNDHHFCVYCLTINIGEADILGKINYWLTIMKPKDYSIEEYMKIYCILHFDLPSCKQFVEEQIPDDYDLVSKPVKFTTGRYDSFLEINIDKEEAKACGWMITLESERKIYAEDVNFFNYRTPSKLVNACKTTDHHRPYPHTYPPRFVIEVSALDATGPSMFTLTFNGAKRDLSIEIPLHPKISNPEDLPCDSGLLKRGPEPFTSNYPGN